LQEVHGNGRRAAVERDDFRAGIVASVIANVNRGKGAKPFTPQDFMPRPAEKKAAPPKQPAEEQIALARAITKANGGTVK